MSRHSHRPSVHSESGHMPPIEEGAEVESEEDGDGGSDGDGGD